MDYVNLGHSGLKVSSICLGALMFGGPTSEADSAAIIAAARDAGVNFLDTADAYNGGNSEVVVGRAIKPERDRWVLATKAANAMGEGPNERGLSRKWLMQAAEASLKRLGTDYIDILYLHKEDHDTPLEETVRALGDLVQAGKLRYFGLSNHRSWRIAEICNLCDGMGIGRPVVSQPLYNAFNRMIETEHLPACDYYGLGVAPYSPLARGILSGKYKPNEAPPEGTRAARNDRRMMQTEWRPESVKLAQKVAARAAKRGMSPGQFACLWVLANPIITSVIAGPRTMEQWQDYLGMLEHSWNPADEAFIDGLVAPGHPSTPGYNDPAYPLEGRPV